MAAGMQQGPLGSGCRSNGCHCRSIGKERWRIVRSGVGSAGRKRTTVVIDSRLNGMYFAATAVRNALVTPPCHPVDPPSARDEFGE